MKIIKPSYEILTPISDGGIKELQHIEKIGRVCYKSEDRITDDGESAKKFVKMLISNGHEAMIEHSSLSVKFVVDRGVSHELVRHRIASFAQESTRYCNYSKDKFGNEITVILPCFFDTGMGILSNSLVYQEWKLACECAEERYFNLLKIDLKTGRHHQIRVQFQNIGFPLFGDQFYGEKNKEQIALFAYKISFNHPVTKELLTFSVLPDYGAFTKFNMEEL